MIGTGAMCDPYFPGERKLLHTRRCVELIEKYGFGLAVQTKSTLCLRDLDLFEQIQRRAKCVVQITPDHLRRGPLPDSGTSCEHHQGNGLRPCAR